MVTFFKQAQSKPFLMLLGHTSLVTRPKPSLGMLDWFRLVFLVRGWCLSTRLNMLPCPWRQWHWSRHRWRQNWSHSVRTFWKQLQKALCSSEHQPNQLSRKHFFSLAHSSWQLSRAWIPAARCRRFSSSVRPNNFPSMEWTPWTKERKQHHKR